MFVFDLALTQLYTQDNFITETLSVWKQHVEVLVLK
jgi:hypothetical protein